MNTPKPRSVNIQTVSLKSLLLIASNANAVAIRIIMDLVALNLIPADVANEQKHNQLSWKDVMNWNEMTQDQRHDWLHAAGVFNFSFKFIDWEEIPEHVRAMLNSVFPPHIAGSSK